MIPKRIFYCWFGRGTLPKSAQKCIASWRKYCPDYEIIEVNEDNFDVNATPYTEYMYKHKKYAFVSDYARLKVVYDNGGIYMDTDVELYKSLDPLLVYKGYFGFEDKNAVNTGMGFGGEEQLPVLADMIHVYQNLTPENNKFQPVICTAINTEVFQKYGLQMNGKTQFFEDGTIAVFPPEYFNPYNGSKKNPVINRTENTFSIHWYDASWITVGMRVRLMLGRAFYQIFGDYPTVWIKKRISVLRKER